MPAGPATRPSRRTDRSRPTKRRRHRGHALAGVVLGMMAVSAAFLLGGPAGESAPRSDAQESAASFAAVRMALDPEARPAASTPAPVQPVAFTTEDERLFTDRHATRIVLASANIDAEVRPVGYTFRNGRLEYDVPQQEAGHYVGTGQPGRPGNAVIGGHVARRGGEGIFASLLQVRAGDIVEVHQAKQIYRYVVTEIRIVAADATSVMSPTQDATLTLITCFPDDGYQERLVVVGRLIESA